MEVLITSIISLVIIAGTVLYFLRRQSRLLDPSEIDQQFVREEIHDSLMVQYREKEQVIGELQTRNAVLQTQLNNELANIRKEKERLKEMEGIWMQKFENLANKITKSNSESFSKDAAERMDQLLKPMNKTFESLERQIKDTHESRIRETTAIRGELERLGKLNHELQLEASNLTNALTLKPKHQGNWGEQVLETLLEKAGLVKNIHFHREVTGETDERKLRPDVILNLPDDRNLVIDSKVSLTAYNRYVSSTGMEADHAIKEHVQSLKNHIDTLAKKRYEDLHQINSPDMIFLFMPIEGGLICAVQENPELYTYALERNVMLTTTSTLFVSLRLVSDLWQRDKQYENAELIAKEAGKLHGQILKFMEEMTHIEKGLNDATQAYQNAKKRLSSGNNNVIRVATRIEDLGAKVKPNQKSAVVMKKIAG